MRENAAAFDIKQPFNQRGVPSAMIESGFFNTETVELEKTAISAKLRALWDAAMISEFPDPVLRDWAAHGGPLPKILE